MDKKRKTFKSIDEYIKDYPLPVRKKLIQLRNVIKAQVPQVQEKISYRMPAFFLNKNLVYFAAYEKHIGFYPGAAAITEFKSELAKFKTSKGTVQLPHTEPLPLNLIRKMIRFRVKTTTAASKRKPAAIKKPITVQTTVNAAVDLVWNTWNRPEHITRWCHASEDWHAPYAENDLWVNGRFKTTMAAKDGSSSFDFEGNYITVTPYRIIEYLISDGRRVKVSFSAQGHRTRILEIFEPENINPVEMQRDGWQAILDNFKKYTETFSKSGSQ